MIRSTPKLDHKFLPTGFNLFVVNQALRQYLHNVPASPTNQYERNAVRLKEFNYDTLINHEAIDNSETGSIRSSQKM